MRPALIAALALTLSAAGAGAACAASLSVPLDRSVRLTVPGAAASVVVGNPAVADVTVVDTHTLFVSGRGFGSTDIVVLDASGRVLVSTDVSVSPPNTGHVSVYRGAARTDLACSPGCQLSPRAGTSAGVGGGGGGMGSVLGVAGAGALGGMIGAINAGSEAVRAQ